MPFRDGTVGDFTALQQMLRAIDLLNSRRDLPTPAGTSANPVMPVQPMMQIQTGDTGAHDVSTAYAAHPLSAMLSAIDYLPRNLPHNVFHHLGRLGSADVTYPVAPSQPAQSPAWDAGSHDVSPPTTSQPVSLTHTTSAIHSSYDGQVIENLDIYVTNGNAITITNDNVTLKNVRIHHAEGNGVVVSGANNVTIENVEVINSSPPSGTQPETSENINNVYVVNSPNLTVHNATLRDGSSGIYLVNSPGADISHVDGYDFHGPFPRGQFVQFNNSGNSTLTDFYVLNHATTSHPEDNVSVYASPNVTISNGVIDGNNSRTGVGVMLEDGSTGGRVVNVDVIHMGNGGFSAWDGANNVTFNDTRSFDNIHADQGRGFPTSNAVIWAVNASGVSILNSTYTDPGNPGNIVWQGRTAAALDVHEAANATLMEHIVNHYAWS